MNKKTTTGLLNYLALGDSYTIGECVTPSKRWSNQLVNLIKQSCSITTNLKIIAQTGWTTRELLNAIAQTALPKENDLVTLLIGVNNQYRHLPQDEYRQQFHKLLSIAIFYAYKNPDNVLVLSIPDWSVTPFAKERNIDQISAEIDSFNNINRSETLASGAHYLDITPISRLAASEKDLIASDGLHPSGKMYTQWAALALPIVQKIFRCL